MIIQEVCPKCGGDLLHISICTYPPIPSWRCPKCGWYFEGQRERVIRVPFDEGKSWKDDVEWINRRNGE